MKEKASGIQRTKKSLFVLLLMIFSALQLFAQSEISGVIKDEKGEPVIGATVKVKGTGIGTITDFNGVYTLTGLPADAKELEVSYVGMETQTVKISGAKADVQLKEVSKEMTELVVQGDYGPAVKKTDLISTISTYSGEEFEKHSFGGALDGLKGQIGGLNITQTEGDPDAEMKVRIRGGTSITQGNDPLYIVDGFPVTSINDIPASNIKSVQVLKDASATSIYGSRGANGVIIVTTKTPMEGKFSVDYNGFVGVKWMAKQLDVLDSYDYALWQYERAMIKGNGDVTSSSVSSDFSKYFDTTPNKDVSITGFDNVMSQYKGLKTNNWQDSIFGNTGVTSNHTLAVSGGSKSTSFNLTYNRIDDKAIMDLSSYKKDYVDFKLNSKPFDNFKLTFTARYSDARVNGSGSNDLNAEKESTGESRLKNAVMYSPIDIDVAEILEGETDINFITSLIDPNQNVKDNYKSKRQISYTYNARAQWEPIKNLEFKSDFGMLKKQNDNYRFYGLTTSYARQNENLPIVTSELEESVRYKNTNTVSYEFKKLGKKQSNTLSFLLGEETTVTNFETSYSRSLQLPSFLTYDDALGYIGTGSEFYATNTYPYSDNMISFFGRANYDFAKKYYVTGTLRADGSSKFAPGNRWGYFPSAAFGWRMSSEKFMKKTKKWLYDLKFRASMGQVGNNNIEAGQYFTVYSPGYEPTYTTLGAGQYYGLPTRLTNPDLVWETTITRNAGFDYGLFKNRVNGTLDFFWNTTRDLLIDYDIALSGYSNQFRNIGVTSSKGIEFVVNSSIIKKKKFSLDVNFNASYTVTNVEDLGEKDNDVITSGWSNSIDSDYRVFVGQPVGLIWGYEYDGRYEASDFEWDGVAKKWKMNSKYTATTNAAGETIYVDASGNQFVNANTALKYGFGPGSLKLKDISGKNGIPDGIIDTYDQTIIGETSPILTGGFSMSATYKAFDLSAVFTYVIGNDVYNANKMAFNHTEQLSYKLKNMTSEMANGKRWTYIDEKGMFGTPGAYITDVDQLTTLNANTTNYNPMVGYVLHSGLIEDGSFLRLSSLTFGCTIPSKWMKKLGVQKFRVYASGSNLFILTNYSGYDPEVDTRRADPRTPNVDFSAYPKNTAVNFGVNLTF